MIGYLGIDVAKDTFTATFLTVDEQDNPIEETTATFPLDLTGWQSFRLSRARIETFLESWKAQPASNWVVGLEASGPYTRLLLHHLQSLPYPVHLLSPLQVRRFRQSQSLRKTKTDPIDARALAHFLHDQHRRGELEPAGCEKALRDLVRLHEQLTRELVRVQNQFRQTLHFLFLELERRTPRFSRALRRILAAYPSAQAVAQADPQHLQTLLTQGPGAAPAFCIDELQELARRSLGVPDPAAALHLQHLLALWEALEEQCHQVARTLMKETRRRYPQAWSLLLAIPGLGPLLVSCFLALVDDPGRFASPKALQAYAGLDPSVYQSGRFQGRSRLSKRGDPLLRKVLYLMAQSLIRYTHRFHQVFCYYRDRGRRYREAIVIVARKVLTVLYTLWTRLTPFQDTAPSAGSS